VKLLRGNMSRRSAAAVIGAGLVALVSCGPGEIASVRPVFVAAQPAPARAAELMTSPIVPATPSPRDAVAAERRPAPARAATPSTGRIVIPRIGLDHPTFEGVDADEIDQGPSHWTGTAMPGEPGNTVFAGHRVTHTHPFYDIDLLQVGDEVTFEYLGSSFRYEVTDHFVVEADAKWIADPTDGTTFTLFACHPKNSYRQRYVVVGKLASAPITPPPPAAPETARDVSPGARNCVVCRRPAAR
jgi:sortase A